MTNRRKCETCRHWRRGDPSGRYENVGVCVALSNGGPRPLPYWAVDHLHKTISWNGERCPSWTQRLDAEPVEAVKPGHGG